MESVCCGRRWRADSASLGGGCDTGQAGDGRNGLVTSASRSVGKKPVSRHDGLGGSWSGSGFLDGGVDSEKVFWEGNVVGWPSGRHCASVDSKVVGGVCLKALWKLKKRALLDRGSVGVLPVDREGWALFIRDSTARGSR